MSKTKQSIKKQRGFTLIEIMVVVIIIGLLATMVLPKVIGRQEQALQVRAKTDVRTISQALELYKLDNFNYPATQEGLSALVSKPGSAKNWQKGGYLNSKTVPQDPWGNDYQYRRPGKNGEFDLWSNGADGKDGGSDENKDIGNWNLDE